MARMLLTRSETNLPFTMKLREVGVPVESLLRKAMLPIHRYDERSGMYLPTHLVHGYRTLAADQTGIEDLGFHVGRDLWRVQGASSGFLRGLEKLPTLKLVLDHLSKKIRKESLGSNIWFVSGVKDDVFFCWNRSLVRGYPVCKQSSLYFFAAMTELIRIWTGRDWYPKQVFMPSYLKLSARQLEVFRDARFIPTRDVEGFLFPRSFLASKKDGNYSRENPARSSSSPNRSAPQPEGDLVGQLQQLLSVYLADGYPKIALAAAVSGCTVRTLQRRLQEKNVTYSELIERIRYLTAKKALEDSDIPLLELAYDLGYSSQANFTRAFSRIAGVSPALFRRQQRFS